MRFPDAHAPKAKGTLKSLVRTLAKKSGYYRDTQADAQSNIRKDGTPSPSSTKVTIDLMVEKENAAFPLIQQLSEKEPSIYELNKKKAHCL